MAAALVGSPVTDGGVSASSSTISVNCTGASKLVVGFCIRDVDAADRTPISCTFNGTAMTLVTPANDGVAQSAGFYYLDSPAQTTANVVITYNASVVSAIVAYALTDVATGAPSHTAAYQPGTLAANPSVSINELANGIVFAQCTSELTGTSSFVTTGGGVEAMKVTATRIRIGGYRLSASTATGSLAFTIGSGRHAVLGIAFGPAGTPPAITGQPSNVTIPAGTTATLSVAASGVGNSYQWYQGTAGTTTTPVGTNSTSFTTPKLTAATTSYWCRVTNAFGSADSATAVVTTTLVARIGRFIARL